MNRKLTLIVPAIALAALAAGCGKTHATSPAASGAASSASAALHAAATNTAVQADLNASEQALLANLQAGFSATHPVKSVKAAVAKTYPHGSTSKIADYAVKTFTIAVLHTKGAGSPRDTWLQGVDTYARSLGATAATAAPSPAVTG